MKDILIPISALLFIALFIYAIVKEGRKRKKLLQMMANVPWRIDLQVRKDRLAVYPSSRNFQVKSVQDLERLIEFSQIAADCLTKTSNER